MCEFTCLSYNLYLKANYVEVFILFTKVSLPSNQVEKEDWITDCGGGVSGQFAFFIHISLLNLWNGENHDK